MSDRDYHLYSGLGTLTTVGVLVAIGVLNTYGEQFGCGAKKAHATVDPFANMRVIDAALAQAASKPITQPQREFRPPPPPPDKPVGVETDANAKPLDKPVEEPKVKPPDKPVDPSKLLDKYRRPDE